VVWLTEGFEREFDQWHTIEDMPERLGIPGFLRGVTRLTRHHELFSSAVFKNDPKPAYPAIDESDVGLYEYVRHYQGDQFIRDMSPLLVLVRFAPGLLQSGGQRSLQRLKQSRRARLHMQRVYRLVYRRPSYAPGPN